MCTHTHTHTDNNNTQQNTEYTCNVIQTYYWFNDIQCENWCKDGVDLLASQSVSDTDSKGRYKY